MSAETQTNDEGRITAVSIDARAQPAVMTSSPLRLALTPHFTTEYRNDGTERVIRDQVLVTTRIAELRPWAAHLREHRMIQELVALAYWWPCAIHPTHAIRSDDPDTLLSGESVGETWREVSVPRAGRPDVHGAEQLPLTRLPLFTYDDIGPVGLQRWIDNYDVLGRMVWILSASLYQQHRVIEPTLLQVGTALEVLGLQIAATSGTSPARTNRFTFVDLVNAIGRATACSLDPVTGPGVNFGAWSKSFNRAYKGVKHADNPLPDPDEARALGEQGIRLIRLWIATDLGVPAQALDERHYVL